MSENTVVLCTENKRGIAVVMIKNLIQRIYGEAPHQLARAILPILCVGGRKCLDKLETAEYFRARDIPFCPEKLICMEHKKSEPLLSVTRSGIAAVGQIYLDLDYGTRRAIIDFEKPRIHYAEAAALWSHHWMGYYHWLLDIAPKICLLKEQLGERFDAVKLCYPSSGERFEKEVLEMLAIPASAIHNTLVEGPVKCGTLWVNPLPGWEKIHPAATLLRAHLLEPRVRLSGPERIYLKRAGRRRCLNEEEVCSVLADADFTILEDTSRSVGEQIDIFRAARVIVAPHGAALSNLLWCEEGTVVIELLSAGYLSEYYRNLALMRGLDYMRLVSPSSTKSHWTAVGEDFEIDVDTLQKMIAS